MRYPDEKKMTFEEMNAVIGGILLGLVLFIIFMTLTGCNKPPLSDLTTETVVYHGVRCYSGSQLLFEGQSQEIVQITFVDANIECMVADGR